MFCRDCLSLAGGRKRRRGKPMMRGADQLSTVLRWMYCDGCITMSTALGRSAAIWDRWECLPGHARAKKLKKESIKAHVEGTPAAVRLTTMYLYLYTYSTNGGVEEKCSLRPSLPSLGLWPMQEHRGAAAGPLLLSCRR